jgi:lipopolysaccharide/colanic/teichoic acid biosynthesis glycosyltransferase
VRDFSIGSPNSTRFHARRQDSAAQRAASFLPLSNNSHIEILPLLSKITTLDDDALRNDTDNRKEEITLASFNTAPLIATHGVGARPEPHGSDRGTGIYRRVKWVVEKFLSLLLLIMLAPIFLLLGLAIRWDSPGPVIFRQTRVGKDGEPFTLLKFRTMYSDIDKTAHKAFANAFVNGKVGDDQSDYEVFKPASRNQITRVGNILRRTSLDELPQLLNVIRGEMSLIGPRPNILEEAAAYKEWHKRRLAVLPGITGLAQVNGRSRLSFDEIVRYDIGYIENECLGRDLEILWHTLPAVLVGEGVR